MKIRLFLYFLISLALLMNQAYAEDFSLSILLKEIEESKDSSHAKYSLLIKNQSVDYFFEHKGGRRDDEKVEKIITLSTEQLQQLQQILSDPIFEHNVIEIKPVTKLGHSIELELKLERKCKMVESKVVGTHRVMRTGQSEIENVHLYQKIRAIIVLVNGGKSGSK